jgi:hypothetical protein
MPFNPSGVFERVHDWTDDRDNEIKIDADRADAEDDGFAAAINAIVSGTQGSLDGAVDAPTVRFHGDADSGLFLESDGVIGLSIAGTKEIEFKAGVVNVINELQIAGTSVSALSRPSRVADGAISVGDVLARQADGTVKAITTVSGGAETGANAVFNAGSSHVFVDGIASDPNTGKFLITYRDLANSNYGTAVVATVTGTAISFGTPVVFEAANTNYTSVEFDPVNEKFLIVYSDAGNSSYVTAIVCTVTGTTPSFGTPVVHSVAGYRTSLSYDVANAKFLCVYGSASATSQGVVISISGTTPSFGTAVQASANSGDDFGTVYNAATGKHIAILGRSSGVFGIVGTISGTSISWGSEQTIASGVDGYQESGWTAGPDSNGKYLTVWENGNDSSNAYMVVWSIAGSTITAGTALEFNDSASVVKACVYFPDDDEFWVLFTDGDNSSYLTSTTITITGTVPSASAFTVVRSANPTTYFAAHFDVTSGVALVAYRDVANSDYGTAFAHTPSSITTNADKWFAIASSDAADEESVQLWTVGGIASGLTGLTYDETYYVDIDGTLTTSVTAYGEIGIALSATELFITKAGA